MQKDEKQLTNEAEARAARREFLKKAGRFAVYTPPAMMVLMRPSSAGIARSGASCRNHSGHQSHDGKSWEPRSNPLQFRNRQSGGFNGHSNEQQMRARTLVTRIRSFLRSISS